MKVTLFVRESRAKSSKGSAQLPLPLIICFRNGKMNLWQTTRLSVNPDWWDSGPPAAKIQDGIQSGNEAKLQQRS